MVFVASRLASLRRDGVHGVGVMSTATGTSFGGFLWPLSMSFETIKLKFETTEIEGLFLVPLNGLCGLKGWPHEQSSAAR